MAISTTCTVAAMVPMKDKKLKKIIDEGTKRGLKAINLNNFGESFYNKNIIEMIEYAKAK